MKKILAALLIVISSSPFGRAGSVTIENFDISGFYPNATPLTGTISVIFGTYSSGVFTPFFSNTQSAINTGYFDSPGNELSVTVTQSDNSIITSGSSLFISIFNVPGGGGDSTWTSSTPQIVLSDPSWIAPTFTLTTPTDNFVFTANTTAVAITGLGTGTYNYNGGSPEVTLVPEPSTYALLAISAAAFGGYIVRRRNRA